MEEQHEENAVEKKSLKVSWVKMKPAELEEIVVEMAKKGETPAQIGITLRDKYGIPKSKLLGKKIIAILKEKGISYPNDKTGLDKKVGKLRSHISKNKHDYSATRALTRRLWDIYHIEKKG